MNPDSTSSENNALLPEVPSILPPTPTPIIEPGATETESPALAAEPVPATAPETITTVPSPAQPPVRPAAVINTPFVPLAGIVSDIRPARPLVSSSPSPVQETVSPFSAAPQTQPASDAPKKRSKGLLVVGLVVGGFALISGVAAVLLLFVFGANGKVAESDLVSTTADGTTYLRPKQWQPVTVGTTAGYGDKLAKDGKSSAMVLVSKGSYTQGFESPTDEIIAALRKNVSGALTPTTAAPKMKSDGDCSEVKDVTIAESTVKNDKSFGIVDISGTCLKDGITYKMVYYLLIGNDGYVRTTILVATEANWNKNEAVFNKMIDSANQE